MPPEVLSVGTGRFGSLCLTHFFNGLEDTVRRVEDETALQEPENLTELSAVACGPFYREERPGRFSPNVVLIEGDAVLPSAEIQGLDARTHPYQRWAETRRAGDKLEPCLDLKHSATRFTHISDFTLPQAQVAQVRPQRPLSENGDLAEDAVRRQLEKSGRVDGVCLATELATGYEEWDVPPVPRHFLLDEVGRVGFLLVAGASPLKQRLDEAENALNQVLPQDLLAESSLSVLEISRSQSRCKALLAAIRDFHGIYSDFKGTEGRVVLPVALWPDQWAHSGEAQIRLAVPGAGNVTGGSVFETAAMGALALDAATLPFRIPLSGISAYSLMNRLVPSFAPVAIVATAAARHKFRGEEVTVTDLSGCMYNEGFMDWPGHDFWAHVQHGSPLLSRTSWTADRKRFWRLPEPMAVSNASPWMVSGWEDTLALSVESLIRSPLRVGVQVCTGKDKLFLHNAVDHIEAAWHNTSLIDRSARDEWVEIREDLITLLEDLKINTSNDSGSNDST